MEYKVITTEDDFLKIVDLFMTGTLYEIIKGMIMYR